MSEAPAPPLHAEAASASSPPTELAASTSSVPPDPAAAAAAEAWAPTSNREFVAEMERLAGRPLAEDALAFLRLATRLGSTLAAEKGLSAPPSAPAHWDSLVAAILVSDIPVCRWLRMGLLRDFDLTEPALQSAGLLPSPAGRHESARSARLWPAPRGDKGWLTDSAEAQLRAAGRLAPEGRPLAAEHIACSVLAEPAPGHEARIGAVAGGGGRSPQHAEIAAAWAEDRRPSFARPLGTAAQDWLALLESSDLTDPAVAAVPARVRAGTFDPAALPIPFLAALSEEVSRAPTSLDARLAAELHPFLALERPPPPRPPVYALGPSPEPAWEPDRGVRTLFLRARAIM
jgi:hypothetical protein